MKAFQLKSAGIPDAAQQSFAFPKPNVQFF
jgi:hypothetical protein